MSSYSMASDLPTEVLHTDPSAEILSIKGSVSVSTPAARAAASGMFNEALTFPNTEGGGEDVSKDDVNEL